jgi:peptide/nickel transport system ATP-binding protein
LPQLEIKQLKTQYFLPEGVVRAVDGVSLNLEKGDSLGIAGESACGKTTLALSIMRLIPRPGKIVGGEILFEGENLCEIGEEEFRSRVRWEKISMIFQGALNALNPLFRVGDQIVEAIQIHNKKVTKADALKITEELLSLVQIDTSRTRSYPFELSGGMRQRVMTAMALACNPSLVIADEPTTALDVIVARSVMDLLKDLQRRLDLSMILITHDLSVIAQSCNKTAIMYAGRIVEYADTVSLFKDPLHPYSQALLSAFPSLKGKLKRMKAVSGFPPDLIDLPHGCRFAPRCPITKGKCKQEEAELMEMKKGHYVACHFEEQHHD